MKDRYGVVNTEMREKYEKEYQVPYGHDYICYDADEAIKECNKLNEEENFMDGMKFIVERIYDDAAVCNNREEIYRSEE